MFHRRTRFMLRGSHVHIENVSLKQVIYLNKRRKVGTLIDS